MISMIGTVAGITLSLIALYLMGWVQSTILLGVLLVLGLMCLGAYVRLMLIVLQ